MRLLIPAMVLLLLLILISNSASKESRSVVQASEILERIQKGEPANYSNVVIEGDLDLRTLDLAKKHINRTGYEIYLRFPEYLTIVDSEIIIKNSSFEGYVFFTGSEFNRDVSFIGSQFSRDAFFQMSQFNTDVYFNRSQFNGNAYFSGCQFMEADFSGSRFSGDAYFWRSQFLRYVDFEGSQLNGNVDFTVSQFNGDANFYRSQFNRDADFRWATFEKRLDFKGMKLSNPFSSFACDWGIMKAHLSFDDADSIYYHYRIWRLKELWREGQYLSMPFDILALVSCGFGVLPSLPLLWSALLIFGCAAVFWRLNGIRRSSDHGKEKRARWMAGNAKSSVQRVNFSEALYFSTLVFFVTAPIGYLQPQGRWRYLVLAEDILGWLLITLFTVTLGNVMIR
ncbi:MAG TPA: pentapeptide repeat-containing protein [Methanotrichaceae archaeon]|nr:pentapeptide repeat-containing protein [Methanotrichaceae archaeon]